MDVSITDAASPVESGEGEPDLASREADYEAFIWANLKRNYLGNYLHGMLGMTGFRLINAPTFLPAYLFAITGSNSVVGLSVACQQLGGIVSPVFGAAQIEHRKKVMPMAVLTGGLARAAVLGMGASGWLLKGNALAASILFFVLVFGTFMGAQRVIFATIMAKVIPISRRGRLQAWRNFTGGLISAGMAYLAGRYLVGPNLFGNGYGVTFLVAFVLTSLGLWALQFLLREPEPPTVRTQGRLRERLRDFPALISADPAYAFFLLVQMLANLGRIGTPFYILYVARSMHMTGGLLGLLSLAFLGADTTSSLLWGYLGDKSGFRLVLLASLLTWAGATVLLMSIHAPWAVVIAFCGLGAGQSGYNMSAQTMILEFGDRHDLPMRVAVSTTAEAITATLGPLIGGPVADAFGYDTVFGVSIGVLASGLLLLLTKVKEPRIARLAAL